MVSLGVASVSAQTLGGFDSAATFTGESVSIDVLSNDVGQELTIKSVNKSSVGWGSIVISEDKKSLTYTPHASYTGHDEFWYVLEDRFGTTNAAKVIVNVVNRSWPAANSDTAKATYNQIIYIPVLANDEGVELKVISVNEGSLNQGKVQIVESGAVLYQQLGEPRGNQTDEFWYVFEDKWGRKNAAKVTVYLSETDSPKWPTATPDQAKSENGLRIFIPVLENDIGDDLTLKSTNAWTQSGGKSVIVNDRIRYTPPADFEGADAFWYVFEDKQGRTNSAKVEVDVTQNTKLSVVEYCGKTYETDGTLENTVSTALPVVPTGPNNLALNRGDFSHVGAIVDGRHYYREIERVDSSGFFTTIWMVVNSVKTRVAWGRFDDTLYPVGAFNKHFYYAKNGELFAHDGAFTIDLTKFIEGEAGLVDGNSWYSINGEASKNTLYLRTISGSSDSPFVKNSYWRISDGLDLQPVFLSSLISSIADSYDPDYINRIVMDKAYFNGLDYTAHNLIAGRVTPPSTENFEVTQQDNDKEPVAFEGHFQEFFEHADRFFVMTKAYDDRVDNQLTRKSGKLYAINNNDDSFVELATCNSLD